MKQSELQVNSLGYRWSFEGGGGHCSVGCWKAGSKRLAIHSSNSSMTAVCSSILTLDSSASCPAAPPKSTASTDRNIIVLRYASDAKSPEAGIVLDYLVPLKR